MSFLALLCLVYLRLSRPTRLEQMFDTSSFPYSSIYPVLSGLILEVWGEGVLAAPASPFCNSEGVMFVFLRLVGPCKTGPRWSALLAHAACHELWHALHVLRAI